MDLFRRLQISALPMGFLLIFKRNLGTSYFKKVSRNPLKRSEGLGHSVTLSGKVGDFLSVVEIIILLSS